jgi:hypothetical protein
MRPLLFTNKLGDGNPPWRKWFSAEQGGIFMPVFFFHVRGEGEYTVDQAGSQLDDIDDARRTAERFAGRIVATSLERGEPMEDKVFEICDHGGTLLAVVPFSQKVHLDADEQPVRMPSYLS